MFNRLKRYQDWQLAQIAQDLANELHFAIQNDWHKEAASLSYELGRIRKEMEKRNRAELGMKWYE